MRTGRKAEVHKAGRSNGPTSCRPGVAELMRREEADNGGNGQGDSDPGTNGDENLDFAAVEAFAEERAAAASRPPKLGDVLKQQPRS